MKRWLPIRLAIGIALLAAAWEAGVGPLPLAAAGSGDCISDPTMAALPPVLVMDSAVLATSRCAALAGAPDLQAALAELRGSADKAMRQAPLSVVQKQGMAPSGDPHDYLSLSVYYWPNPATADGLPYVQRDGQFNPEWRDNNAYDAERLDLLVRTVDTLALASYLTADQAYAEHAAELLRTWFLDPATRMNPNLMYSQEIPGQTRLRGTGIIEGRAFIWILDDVGLLANSGAWTTDDQAGMQSWMASMLDWLQSSPQGKLEASSHNNHQSWYDAQAADLAAFTGQTDVEGQLLGNAEDLVAAQIAADGSQPLELARTRPLHYSDFNLQADMILARLGDQVSVDLWSAPDAGGAPGLESAIDFVLAGVDSDAPAVATDITPVNRFAELEPILEQAAREYPQGPYAAQATALAQGQDPLAVLEDQLGASAL